jgi:hypothetical protein
MEGKEARSERLEAESIAVAIGALICGGVFGYHAASNEFTGKATYQPGIRGSSVTVTREDSPFRWGVSGFYLAVSVVSFIFYRKHDDGSEDCV